MIYEPWKETFRANVVRDPRTHPDAIIADFSDAPPLVKAEIAFVYERGAVLGA